MKTTIYLTFLLIFFTTGLQAQHQHLWQYQDNFYQSSSVNTILYYGDSTWFAGGTSGSSIMLKILEEKDPHFESLQYKDTVFEGYSIQKIIKAHNGDILAIGFSGTQEDVAMLFSSYLGRFDKKGTKLWGRYLKNDHHNYVHYFTDIKEAADGSIFVSDFNGYLLKFSSSGTLEWERRMDLQGVTALYTGSDGQLIICGNNAFEKTDTSGHVLWKHTALEPLLTISAINDTSIALLDDKGLYLSDTAGDIYDTFSAGTAYKRLNLMACNDTSFYVYALDSNGEKVIFCLGKQLRVLWQQKIDGYEVSSMVLGNGQLAIAGTGGTGPGHFFVKNFYPDGSTSIPGGGSALTVTLKGYQIIKDYWNYHPGISIYLTAHIRNTSDLDIDSIGMGTLPISFLGANMGVYNRYRSLGLKAGDSTQLDLVFTLPLAAFYNPVCIFTTGPNNTLDNDISNDEACVTVPVVGIREDSFSSLLIFPNPISDNLFIQNNQGLKGKYTIYDVLGKEIIPSSSLIQGENVISLSTLPKGIYFLKIKEGENERVEKVIKQ